MAWVELEWACGHTGRKQMYGKGTQREAQVAKEAGRKCMACWLVSKWEKQGDNRANRADRYILAGKIAEGKGIQIRGLPEEAPTEQDGPLAAFTDNDILEEAKRRGLV